MDYDLTPYFKKYEDLVEKADAAFERVKTAYADCVKCEEKCADCCFALFDLTLIEALYINHKFKEKFKGKQKVELLEKANRADRRIHKIKRDAYKELKAGKNEGEILADMALQRVRCPMLFVQGTRDAGDPGADGEGQGAESDAVHAAGLGRLLGVAQRLEGAPDTGTHEAPDEQGDERERAE